MFVGRMQSFFPAQAIGARSNQFAGPTLLIDNKAVKPRGDTAEISKEGKKKTQAMNTPMSMIQKLQERINEVKNSEMDTDLKKLTLTELEDQLKYWQDLMADDWKKIEEKHKEEEPKEDPVAESLKEKGFVVVDQNVVEGIAVADGNMKIAEESDRQRNIAIAKEYRRAAMGDSKGVAEMQQTAQRAGKFAQEYAGKAVEVMDETKAKEIKANETERDSVAESIEEIIEEKVTGAEETEEAERSSSAEPKSEE